MWLSIIHGMPELPEVEVTRLGLAGPLEGAQVLGARLGKPLRWPLGLAPEALAGHRVGALQRRGKYLWLPLASPRAALPDAEAPAAAGPIPGDGPGTAGGLLVHLGMSGSLALSAQAAAPGPHDHFDLHTDRGTLRLTDPRRFGAVVWSPGMAAPPAAGLLARLGAEPFDPSFTAAQLHAALRQRRAPIKTVILGGDIVVGAGNIYVSEALFRAGIDPRARADRIGLQRCERLLTALREVLAQAIALGGSTLRDFRDVHGASGAFTQQAGVYGREGLACRRCGGTVRRLVQGQRSTYFCPGCQRR